MTKKSNGVENNHITTDDLAFSAYLKIHGYNLIKSDQNRSKRTFTFEIDDGQANNLKLEFINSKFASYYNELRNLKKLL